MPDRHDCRDHLPLVGVNGSVAQCPLCEAWWQFCVDEFETGTRRMWRRVRWWHFFARHEVEKERTRIALYEQLVGITREDDENDGEEPR